MTDFHDLVDREINRFFLALILIFAALMAASLGLGLVLRILLLALGWADQAPSA